MLEENLDRHCALGQRRLGIPTEEQIIVHQQKRWDLDFEIAVEKLCRESNVSCGWGACGNISVVSIIPICRAVACCFIAHSRPISLMHVVHVQAQSVPTFLSSTMLLCPAPCAVVQTSHAQAGPVHAWMCGGRYNSKGFGYNSSSETYQSPRVLAVSLEIVRWC